MVDWEAFYRAFRRPDFIPGYEIQNHLGGGAFGEVYKARKRSIGKAYAIKFLKLEGGSQEGTPGRSSVERELDQVRLFASIDHPNLVTIEDMGVVEGVPYLVMGYAGEETLSRLFERRDLPPERALRYFVQVCRGVQALHDRRLAHFDLKPGNVFIKGDVARVGDYGLAKVIVEGRQTLSFGRGTPHYMAPEMLRSRADHRADLYSLGVILYESLTFRLPYGDPQARDGHGGYGAVVREEDRPPPFPEPFPPVLRRVVECCLRLAPEDRYGSVRELLADLGQTAGPADEVDLEGLEGLGAIPRAAPRRAADRNGGPPTPTPVSELRTAAVELARGAVGVAKGVFGGVVERMRPAAPVEPVSPGGMPGIGGSGADETPGSALGGEVVSVETLADEPLEPAPPPDRLEPARRVEPETPRPPATGLRLSAPYGPEGSHGTVPVPPRASGGIVGTLGAGLALGAEILGALVTGPSLLFVRGIPGGVDRLARGVPGVLGSLLKLFLLVVVFAAFGALAAFVVIAGMTLRP